MKKKINERRTLKSKVAKYVAVKPDKATNEDKAIVKRLIKELKKNGEKIN